MTVEVKLPRYMTVNDVCTALSISRRTLERLRSSSNLTPFPEPDLWIGKHPRWEANSLFAKILALGQLKYTPKE